MSNSEKQVIRNSDTEGRGRIVLVEPNADEKKKDIVEEYLDGSLTQEMNDAVNLAARISLGLIEAFPPMGVSSVGDAIMKMAAALGKPLPDELCVPDITKYFYRPLLNTIYKAVWDGRLNLDGVTNKNDDSAR